MSESDANKHLADTARLRMMTPAEEGTAIHAALLDARDPLEDTQPMPVHDRRERMREGACIHATGQHRVHLWARERRKPSTVGERRVQNAVENARDIFADRQQELIEAKLWPQY